MRKWISVKDRLPDENSGRVLMTDGERHYIAPREWMHRLNGAEGIYIPANHGAGAKVTHWMPLPEPPEEEQYRMTNADRIRAMRDEEMAELLLDSCRGSKCEDQPKNEWGSINCFQCRMNWLQQQAEEKKHGV